MKGSMLGRETGTWWWDEREVDGIKEAKYLREARRRDVLHA